MIPMTPWVKRILFANIVVYLVSIQLPEAIYRELVFYPVRPGVGPDLIFRPWTVVSYMFLHDRGGFGHIAFNMIGLYFFGPRLEERLGAVDFLKLYFIAGLGGALLSFLQPSTPIIGASAAVYGVVIGFAVFWPRATIYLFAILPVQAWLLAVMTVVFSLWAGLSGAGGGIAHFAHLGGIVFGFAYLKWREWRAGAAKREFQRKLDPGTAGGSLDRGSLRRWEAIDVEDLHELNRDEVRALLRKARDEGVRSLSASERQFMDRMASTTGA